MLEILENISPVFLVIALGYGSRRLGFLPDAFIQSANRLVYFVAVPILVFTAIYKGPFSKSFDPRQITGTLIAVAAVAVVSLLISMVFRISKEGTPTFMQISIHGNLGYVGLAVVFYALGSEGRGSAGVLAGFLMLFQNFISISAYNFFGSSGRKGNIALAWKFLGNPIILAAIIGLGFSAAEIRLPGFLENSFNIVSDMALPLALLIIGGTLRPAPAKRIQLIAVSTLLKLLLLPFFGYLLFRFLGVKSVLAETGLILMASPSATISYVMAVEMGGKEELAAAAVTVSTLLSIFTYTFWIAVASGM